MSDPITTDKAMKMVSLALLPAALLAVYNFGWNALMLMIVSMATCVATEYFIQKGLKKAVTVNDGSALLTGLLLAMTVTPQLPLPMMVVGAVVAIAIGKQVFGGLGYNVFNPALIGRAFLLASWPVAMTTWSWPSNSLGWVGTNVDAVSGATALGLEKMGVLENLNATVPYFQLLWGNISGSLGETSALLLLLGGLYLIFTKVIDWRIPTSYLATVVVLAFVFQKDPLFHVLAGGVILGAFFMATDWVTSPVTPKGRIFFGIGCGVITMLVRLYGGYPEGVCYSILIMNAVTPLLDRATMPKRFGEVKSRA